MSRSCRKRRPSRVITEIQHRLRQPLQVRTKSAVGSAAFRDAGLIDAALALEWLAGETDEATDDFGEQATLEAVFADQGELFFSATGPVTLSDREVDSAISSAAETEDPDQPWLAEKLLERVFG